MRAWRPPCFGVTTATSPRSSKKSIRTARRGARRARREVRPERGGPARQRRPSELARPVCVRSELGAPGPEAPRREVEAVLVGEADRAVRLVCDARRAVDGLADPRLGDG